MADQSLPVWRPSVSGRGLVGELLTDASSWMVLACYLDAAAWIGVPAAWPQHRRVPGTDFGRLAATAIDALRWGLPDRRDVRVAVILSEPKGWLATSGHADAIPHDGVEVLSAARVYVQAMCPVAEQRTALDLLDPHPLHAERGRQRRRHPIRRFRRPAWPPVLDPVRWQESLWWQRTEQTATTIPLGPCRRRHRRSDLVLAWRRGRPDRCPPRTA